MRVQDSRRQAGPAYSFGSRRNQNKTQCESIGPGPAQYNISGLGAKGKDTPPAMSLQSRPKPKSQFLTPAPGEYNIDKAEKRMVESAPKYTFGLKAACDKPKQTPGKHFFGTRLHFHYHLIANTGVLWLVNHSMLGHYST